MMFYLAFFFVVLPVEITLAVIRRLRRKHYCQACGHEWPKHRGGAANIFGEGCEEDLPSVHGPCRCLFYAPVRQLKIAAMILSAMVFAHGSVVQAAMLPITNGTISGWVLAEFDAHVFLAGEGWSLGASGPCCLLITTSGGVAPFYGPSLFLGETELTVWVADLDPIVDPLVRVRGEAVMIHAPAPPFVSDESYIPFSAPFTMTGHLDLGEGFDLVGHGTLTAQQHPVLVFGYTYTFEADPATVVVSEPTTLPLFVMGLVYLLAYVVVWRTRRG